MSLRPLPARWFELLVLRDDLTAALDVLAKSSRVELQSHGETRAPLLTAETEDLLREFERLDRRYGRYWPTPRARETDERHEPRTMLELALMRLRSWATEAHDLVATLEALQRKRADLELLLCMLTDASESLPDLKELSRAGPMLKSCLYLLAADNWPQALPASVITQRVTAPEHTFLIAVGLPEDIEMLEQQLHAEKGRPITLPDDLPAARRDAEVEVRKRLENTKEQIDAKRDVLGVLHDKLDVADALADVATVRWYTENVPELASTENFAWLTGWTSDTQEEPLLAVLAEAKIKGIIRLAEPPPGFDAPLLLENPRWMRPFEVFVKMLGVPAAGEADPTRIVAIASPLMFGYMFGDVAHGAMLLAAGVILCPRFPVLRLLIAGGVVSIVFGFLFGTVFALDTVIEPLWVNPMDQPIGILVAPMIGGAVLLLVGMCLDAIQAYWQHKGRTWWESGAGLTLCYLALLGTLLEPRLLAVALLGAIWFVVGHALAAPDRRLAAMGTAVVNVLESVLQLVVNTISFVRVGAFALAHAGLSMAVVGVSAAATSTTVRVIVLILGNLLIVGLEGLVVSIQTTRLVLFEFFVRFLRAEGRPFRPLEPVASVPPGKYRRPS